MEPSPLRDWVKAIPFIPFTVTLSNGRQIPVSSPEMVILGRRRDTIAFVDDEGFDRHVIIEHRHIASVDAYDPIQSPPSPQ